MTDIPVKQEKSKESVALAAFFADLQVLFPDADVADQWIQKHNDASPFNGESALTYPTIYLKPAEIDAYSFARSAVTSLVTGGSVRA